MSDVPQLETGTVVAEKWRVIRLLGKGGFASVYVVETAGSEEQFALKAESVNGQHLLKMERYVLHNRGLSELFGDDFEHGKVENINYMVTTLRGPNLSEVKQRLPHNQYSLRTALYLAEKCLQPLIHLHKIGFLHRDVKPHNYALCLPPNDRQVAMLDLGLAREYLTQTGELRPPRPVAFFHGSVRYASLATHQEHDYARVDDLWQWFYMLIGFTVNTLPWNKLNKRADLTLEERLHQTEACKEQYVKDTQKLLEGCPPEYEKILAHLKTLSYCDTPNYQVIIDTLHIIVDRKGYDEKLPLDWEPGASNFQTIRGSEAMPSTKK